MIFVSPFESSQRPSRDILFEETHDIFPFCGWKQIIHIPFRITFHYTTSSHHARAVSSSLNAIKLELSKVFSFLSCTVLEKIVKIDRSQRVIFKVSSLLLQQCIFDRKITRIHIVEKCLAKRSHFTLKIYSMLFPV